MDSSTFWYIQRQMEGLIDLAADRGVDEEPWFLGGWNSLCARWQPRLYQKLVQMCIDNSDKPILPTKFPIPFKKDDMEAVTNGPYKIGVIKDTDIEYSLWPFQIQRHALLGSATGFGKTTFIRVLCHQIIPEDKTLVWVIDPKPAGDYRSLAKHFDNVVVLGRDILRCNPFDSIYNVDPEFLLESVCEVTADSYGVYDASEGVLLRFISKVFDEYEQPTYMDLIDLLNKETGNPKSPWARNLGTLDTRNVKVERSLKRIINCKTDYFSKLYDKNVVIETGKMLGSLQRILVPWIIMKLFLYKIENPTPYLSHILVFDEAQTQLWSQNLELRGRQSFMATLSTQCREFGLGLLVLAQNPATKLLSEIKSNSCIKLCFQLGGDEIYRMSQIMGLNREQMEELFHIKEGEAICRVGLGYTEPVLLEIHNVPREEIDDYELAEMMKPTWDELLSGIELARPEQMNLFKGGIHAPVEAVAEAESVDVIRNELERSMKEEPEVKEHQIELSEDEEAYLRIVKNFLWRLIGEIYRLLGSREIMGEGIMGQSKAIRIRKRLVKKKCLETFDVKGTGRSGRAMCDVLTEKSGVKMAYKPRGGYMHAWWCYRVSEYYLRQGAEVSIGETFDGNEMDVAVRMDDRTIGIEVVVTELVVDNLAKHLSCYDEVRVLCVDEAKKKEVEKRIGKLGNEIQEKVKVELLKDYFIPL